MAIGFYLEVQNPNNSKNLHLFDAKRKNSNKRCYAKKGNELWEALFNV